MSTHEYVNRRDSFKLIEQADGLYCQLERNLWSHCSIMVSLRRIPMIDIFSGIGGFSLALKSRYRTIAYCELDEYARQILHRNMNRRLIDSAVVVHDVKQFTTVCPDIAPKLLTAGFPCQDIANTRFSSDHLDLAGDRSSLAFEVLNIIDFYPSIDMVLLENSSYFQSRGMESLLRLFVDRNFVILWGTFSAYETGGCHLRNRWFALAIKSPEHLRVCRQISFKPLHAQRLLRHDKEQRRSMLRRCALLGNAIVPQCANFAFNTFVKHFTSNASLPPTGCKLVNMGLMFEGKISIRQRPTAPRPIVNMVVMTLDDGIRVERKLWATPTHTHWHQYRNTAYRESLNKLISQICYSDDTYEFIHERYGYSGPKKIIDKFFDINAVWVESLMGYPADWTG